MGWGSSEKKEDFVRKCDLIKPRTVCRNTLVLKHFPPACQQFAGSPARFPGLPGRGVGPSPPEAWPGTEEHEGTQNPF